MNMNTILTEDIRRFILYFLSKDNGYSLNDSTLRLVLDTIGHNLSKDRVLVELAWLSEQGLVTTAVVLNTTVATLTARGLDAAEGRATVPGVKRPSPRG